MHEDLEAELARRPKMTEEQRKRAAELFPGMYFDEYGCNKFNEPIYSTLVFPKRNLSDYPAVIRSNKEVAVIAINHKRGYILHRDGAKTEPSDIEKLIWGHPEIPMEPSHWATIAIGKKPPKPDWETEKQYNDRIREIKKTMTWLK
jgi:hypothetical protein